MKKIISLVFVVVMLFACTVPAYADWFESGEINEGCYNSIYIHPDSEVTINGRVEIESGKWLAFFGDNIVLTIGKGGCLTGNNASFSSEGANHKIIIKNGGWLDITFCYSDNADSFASLLAESGIRYERDGNRITAGYCEHTHTTTTIKTTTVCYDCGQIIKDETYEDYPTASTLSTGYLEIVYGIGGLAVGFFAAMLIFRKKKVVVSSTAADDEE